MNRKIQHGPFFKPAEFTDGNEDDEHSPQLKAMADEFGKKER